MMCLISSRIRPRKLLKCEIPYCLTATQLRPVTQRQILAEAESWHKSGFLQYVVRSVGIGPGANTKIRIEGRLEDSFAKKKPKSLLLAHETKDSSHWKADFGPVLERPHSISSKKGLQCLVSTQLSNFEVEIVKVRGDSVFGTVDDLPAPLLKLKKKVHLLKVGTHLQSSQENRRNLVG